MIIFIAILILPTAITFISMWKDYYTKKEALQDALGVGGVVTLILAVFCIGMPTVVSFDTAIEVDTIKKGIIAEYRDAVEIYEDKAIINIEAMTDFRYEGYQENISKMIQDVRWKIERHNALIISKQAYKNSPFFSWLIIMPEDETLIHIKEKS